MNFSKIRFDMRAITITTRKAKKSLVLIRGAREFVPYPVDRPYELRRPGILFNLVSQVLHVRVYGPVIPLEIISLRYRHELLPRKYTARLVRKGHQNLELRGGQHDETALPEDLPVDEIDLQFPTVVAQ